MIAKDEIKEAVVRTLDEKYGEKLLDVEECRKIQRYYENQRARIKAELNLANPNSKVAQTIANTNKAIGSINDLKNRTVATIEVVSAHLNESEDLKQQLDDCCKKMRMLDCTLQYMKIVHYVEALSEELQKELEKKDDEQCVTIFANISEITRQLAASSAVHLRGYLKEVMFFWHNTLKNKFSLDFDNAMKLIKWPFVNVNFSLEVPLEYNINKLQIIAEYLLQIDLPDELVAPSHGTGLRPDFPRLSLPLELLIEPLRKRFLYHFYGTRKTNRPDKPEWYFTKVLSWIRDHSEFVEKWIQPVMDKMGFYHIEAKTELMRGLVQLAVEKLQCDLPTLQFDDFTFSHCVDEALGFDKELKESYDYPATQPGVLNVLTQAQVFIKWISMEKKYALEKMDAMLSESLTDAFQPIDSDLEGSKVAPYAEAFVTLLQTITERYEVLPQPGHRLQFLELQLELLDDFRLRLLQLVHVEEGDVVDSRIPVIANTIFYIENVLIDWGAMLHFLNLYYYKSQLENPESTTKAFKTDYENSSDTEIDSDTVFVDTLSLYGHMRRDLLATLVESVVRKVKSASRSYRNEMWSKINVPKELRSLSLTPSACPLFQVLSMKLHQLQKSLAEPLFVTVWKSIAQHIDTFLFEEVVLENRFNEGGALQFKFDITRNLFPLFSQYTGKPESYFTQVHEACLLLNVSKGSALLLRETILALEGATGVEDRRGQALKEIGVTYFEPKMAVTILNRRTDITVDRIAID